MQSMYTKNFSCFIGLSVCRNKLFRIQNVSISRISRFKGSFVAGQGIVGITCFVLVVATLAATCANHFRYLTVACIDLKKIEIANLISIAVNRILVQHEQNCEQNKGDSGVRTKCPSSNSSHVHANIPSWSSSLSSAGMVPVKVLRFNKRNFKLDAYPNEDGMVPSSSFSLKSKSRSCFKSSNHFGRVLMRRTFRMDNSRRLVNP